jgi:N-methylhydantoinase A
MAARWRAAADIGGTFTDLLLADSESGDYVIGKVLTDHADPASAVIRGLRSLMEDASVTGGDIRAVTHATTLVTNALIERKGASVALVITAGFRDTLFIGREHRYDMYDVLLQKPDPLVRRRDVLEVPERVLADGTVLRPLDEAAVRSVGRELRSRGVEAVAVCLLHAYRFPEHELRVRELLQEEMPGALVALSHQVVSEQREYERSLTTVVNAYVLDVVDRYLAHLEKQLAGLGYGGEFLIMLSSGATATTATARSLPVRLIESGPAAGALAAGYASKRIGSPSLLSFDMGGTTAKASLIENGRPRISSDLEVDRRERFKRGSGLPLKATSVDLIEIGAGGGSIARVDWFGLLQVGPDSAGSDPGPACYGLGGTEPTVTDADLVLGYLDPGFFLGGEMDLSVSAAETALRKVAAPLGLELPRAAWVIHQVVNENMANAARIHAAERGRSVEALPLFALGGAGPVHAYRVAMSLGIRKVIAPLGAGVGSTMGLLAAPPAFDFVRTAVDRLHSLDWDLALRLIAEMEEAGRRVLSRSGVEPEDVRSEISADMRLVGQAHEIQVDLPGWRPRRGDGEVLEQAFLDTYTSLFERTPPDVSVELINWRVRVFGPDPDLRLTGTTALRGARSGDSTEAKKGERPAYFPESGGFVSTPVYDRYGLKAGSGVTGPAIIEERESSLVIGPGSRAEVLEGRDMVVEIST